jgi:hypothetical protein
MKYKVVKATKTFFSCVGCVNQFQSIPCAQFITENNLPDCSKEDIHFELADDITTTDLKEIDEAREEKK